MSIWATKFWSGLPAFLSRSPAGLPPNYHEFATLLCLIIYVLLYMSLQVNSIKSLVSRYATKKISNCLQGKLKSELNLRKQNKTHCDM